jgi:hypothetical protein
MLTLSTLCEGNGRRARRDRLFRVGKRKSRFPSRTRLSSALGKSLALAARQRLFKVIEIVVNKAGASMSARFGDLRAARLPRGAFGRGHKGYFDFRQSAMKEPSHPAD